MRWQEEVTLTTYEMQWTIRYFGHKMKNWSSIGDRLDKDIPRNAGALAYAKRKYSMWEKLSSKSDRTFGVINSAYKSPI
jgi:hypothetical protein